MKKNKQTLLLFSILSLFVATACDDTTETIGAGLSGNLDHIDVSVDTFNVTTGTELMGAVQSRSANGSLGRIRDYDTGAIVSSSMTTQLYLLPGDIFPSMSLIRSCKPTSESNLAPASIEDVFADEACLYLYPTNIIGDSLQPLHLNVYELERPLPDGKSYQSDYEVLGSPYLSEPNKKLLRSLTITMADRSFDSTVVNSSGYSTTFRIPLDSLSPSFNFHDGKDYRNSASYNGKKYSDYGTYLMQRYYKSKENNDGSFANYNAFAYKVCPGFYLEIDNGEGAMATMNGAKMNVTYRYHTEDSIITATTSLFATEEVLQTTSVKNDEEKLRQMKEDPYGTYIKTPAGLYTVAELPIIAKDGRPGIYTAHLQDSISCAKMSIKTQSYSGLYGTAYPKPTVLMMIPADSVKVFFDSSTIGDAYKKKVSFAYYDSSTEAYEYKNCAKVISSLYRTYQQGVLSNPNWAAEHPNWNKVALIPVVVVADASGNITAAYHDMSFTTAKLVRGNAENPDKDENISMSIIYTKMTD